MVMKYLSMLLLSVILLTSCNTTADDSSHPELKITSELSCDKTINEIESVSLVGYNFESLLIGGGESKTFTLSDGMPAGLKDVNVNVKGKLANNGFNEDISVDFVAGQTTHIIARNNQTGCSRVVELLLGE